jgi:zinc/manganese transport system permease protein
LRGRTTSNSVRLGSNPTLFLALVVLNLVAGFQALGTLMAVELIDVARRGGAILGARAVVAQRREQRIGIGRGFSRPPRLLSPGRALGAGDRTGAGLGYLASVLFGPGDSLRALYFRRGRLEA